MEQPARRGGEYHLALAQAVMGGDQGGNLGRQEQAMLGVGLHVHGLLGRKLQQRHQALQHQHGMQVAGHVAQQFNFRVRQARVPAHKGLQATFFLFLRPVAEQHHPHHVQEGHAHQVIDVDTAVTEQALFALHV